VVVTNFRGKLVGLVKGPICFTLSTTSNEQTGSALAKSHWVILFRNESDVVS
jgi:hypothetical protein